MSWTPSITLRTNPAIYRVSASDLERDESSCALWYALKARPETYPATGDWYLRRGGDYTFTLGPFVKALPKLHSYVQSGMSTPDVVNLLQRRIRSLHPGFQAYLLRAFEQYIELHEAREQIDGQLTLVDVWNEVEPIPDSGATVLAWAPIYTGRNGLRQVRRLRFDSARRERTIWADAAAYVASKIDDVEPTRTIKVFEVGLLDGIEQLVLETTREEAEIVYSERVRPAAQDLTLGVTRTPGQGCDSCKFLGTCPDLIPVPSALQLTEKTAWTRSVSALDLTMYSECPARWYMQRQLKLPRDVFMSEAQDRGKAVHRWLYAAHSTGKPCEESDFPEPSGPLPEFVLGEDLDRASYRIAYGFLRQHVDVCPLAQPGMEVLAAETTFHCYDQVSDVVAVAKPDLVLRRDGHIVFREIKTTERVIPDTADEIRDQYNSVSVNLVLLAHGLARSFGADTAEVQLEMLTQDSSAVFSYLVDDAALLRMARGRVRRLTGEWATDVSWKAKPARHCFSCPVRRWCPDGDAYVKSGSNAGGDVEPDEPPF